MASEAGLEGQRPDVIIAQPIGLGVGKNKIMRAEGPSHQAMSRAFSPCDFYFQIAQPAGLGYYEDGPLALPSDLIAPHKGSKLARRLDSPASHSPLCGPQPKPPRTFMGKQYNKTIKKKRRIAYLKRKKVAAKKTAAKAKK